MTRRQREPETASIAAVTHDGRGIADTVGKKVFVAGALEGETVRFLRRKSRRKFDEAELVEIIDASPERVTARCEVFGRCGGCALQHVRAAQQRDIKSGTLRDNLMRIGNVCPESWLEPIVGPDWHYRRRGRLAIKDVAGKGRVLVGFREKHAPFITDMHRCEVLAEPVDSLLDPLSELVGSLSIRTRLPQVEVAVADNAVALVFRVLDPPSEDDIEAFRRFAVEHETRVYLQPGGLESVSLLAPQGDIEPLYYELPDYDVRIDFEPVDFVQINAQINRRMVRAAVDILDPGPQESVLDLFCGIGNFSLPLARRAGYVLGVEGESALVARAGANAERNHLANVEFRCMDLSGLDGKEPWLAESWDRLLLDPARAGAAEVVRHIGSIDPRRIVYVSCHPGTLARDAAILVHEAGYRLEAAGIIDMFPHTAHVESMAVFSK
jgi:23S rRNA (uracil1939-C5)-methyltransferase